MHTLNRRIAALEQATQSGNIQVIVVRFLRQLRHNAEESPLMALTFSGQRYERRNGESESTFIQRVIGDAKGIQMVLEARCAA